MILRELINKIGFKVDENSFRNAEKKFVSMANKAKFVSVGAAAAAGGLFALTTKAGQAADQLLDLKQITGASTDTLQELKYISADAGVSFESLTGIYSKLTNLLPSIEKGTSDSAKAFDKLGVSLRDSNGDLRSTEDLVPELIMGLQNIENVTERNAMAQKIFGRDLYALGPVMGYTNEQFKALRLEAHEMGAVMGEDTVAQANKFRAVMDKGIVSIKTNLNKLGASFAPVFEDMIFPMLNKGIKRMNAFMAWFDGMGKGVKKGILIFLGVTASIAPMLLIIGKVIGLAGSAVVVAKKVKTAILAVNTALLANPIVLIIVGVMALIAVLVLLVKNFDMVKTKVREFWLNLVKWFEMGRELAGLAVQVLVKQMMLWFFMFWSWFGEKFPGLASTVEVTFEFIKGFISSSIGFWKELFLGVFALFRGDIDGFKDHFIAAFGFLQEYFSSIINAMGGYIDLLWGWVQPIFEFLSGKFMGAVDKVRNGVKVVGEFLGFGEAVAPQLAPSYGNVIRPGVTNNNRRSVNVQSSITLAVPAGTPQYQQQFIQDNAERAVQAAFDRQLKAALVNTAGGEVR